MLTDSRECPRCRKPFTLGSRTTKKYCSDRCTRGAYNQRRQNERLRSDPDFRNRRNARRNKHRKANPTCRLRTVYGLTPETYSRVLTEQNGLCAICRGPGRIQGRLSIDHCHSSGQFRGLLCGQCNSGLGFFKDSIGALESAIDYLRKSNSVKDLPK